MISGVMDIEKKDKKIREMAETKTNMPQLDEVCAVFLNEVQQYCRIEFVKWDNNHCAVQVQQRDKNGLPIACDFYYRENFYHAEICHELLHIKCDHIFGCDQNLMYDATDTMVKRLVMDKKYWQSISNQIQHKIMYQEYLSKGYEPKDFFANMATVNRKEVRNFVASGLKDKGTNVYNPAQLRCYLNVLQHFMFFPESGKFKKELELLKPLNKELFEILEHLHGAIDGVQIDPAYYQGVLEAKHNYRKEMSMWFGRNNVRLPNTNELNIMKQLITD